ncbi:hypothetical protein DXT88_03970 [Herbaspirillum lusitanum]|nr:hypothetical protein [Herbaspirillum lusitanum]
MRLLRDCRAHYLRSVYEREFLFYAKMLALTSAAMITLPNFACQIICMNISGMENPGEADAAAQHGFVCVIIRALRV